MRGNLSIPLCCIGCLCQGSLLLFGVLCRSPPGRLWTHTWKASKETVQLVPHLLCIWLKCEVSRASLSPSHLVASRKPRRFQFPNPLPSPISHEKGSRQLPLGPRSPQGPAWHFPPPARSLLQSLGRCVTSPSGEWIFQAPSEGSRSCWFCCAFVGTPMFPGLGASQAQNPILLSWCSGVHLACGACPSWSTKSSKFYSLLPVCERPGKKMCKMSETVPLLNCQGVTSIQLSKRNQRKFCTCEEWQTWPGALLCSAFPWLPPAAIQNGKPWLQKATNGL